MCLVGRKHPAKGLVTFLNVYRTLPETIVKSLGEVIVVSHDDLSSFDTSGITIIKPNSDAEIAAAYRKSDIFISTSWHEGFGLPPLEAMACGCACILSESGGIDEYARPEENCLTFPPKNEQQLREKLLRLFCDAALRERLAQNGLQTASRFSWEKSTQQLTDIIME